MEKKILFADLDGTLIETASGETFPKGIWDMKFKFDVLDAIKKMNPEIILIASNQGGIENGYVSQVSFHFKMDYVAQSIEDYCKVKCRSMYCTTNDKADPYRKPNPKMLEWLAEKYVGDDFDTIKSKSLMIGDASGKEGQFSDSDKKTAENWGIDYMDVTDFILEHRPKENSDVNDETNAPTEYGKYVDECLNDASKHFFSEGEDKYNVADLFYAGVRCGKSWLEKQGKHQRQG